MFDKKYVLIDLNNVETTIDNLKDFIESYGIASFYRGFVLDIKTISWSERDLLLIKNDSEYYDYTITNSKGRYCSGMYCLRTLSGKKVHPNQVLSEFLDKFPNSSATKKFESSLFRQRMFAVSTGSKKSRYRNNERKIKGLKSVIRDKARFETYEGGRVRVQRVKYENKFNGFFEPYSDHINESHAQKCWKSHRKTQYKHK